MTSTRYVWLICGLAVLILDTLGSLAARHWGFAYGSLSAISFLLYFCAGVGAGRLANVWAGGIAGGVTALIDATLGWRSPPEWWPHGVQGSPRSQLSWSHLAWCSPVGCWACSAALSGRLFIGLLPLTPDPRMRQAANSEG